MTVQITITTGPLGAGQLDRIEASQTAFQTAFLAKLDQLTAQETKELAEIDDLQASVSAIAQADTDVATAIKDVSAKLTTPGISPAEIEALAVELNTHASSLEASAKGLEAAIGAGGTASAAAGTEAAPDSGGTGVAGSAPPA